MTPAELKTEITSGPLATELAPLVAAGDDGQIAAILNDKRYTRTERVMLRDIVRYLLDNGAWLTIVDKASDTTPSQAKNAARNFVEVQKMPFLESLDMSKPSSQGMLSALVGAGVMTAAHQTAITNMGVIPASRAELVGMGTATPQMIAEARAA
jgi:hypothetical protein